MRGSGGNRLDGLDKVGCVVDDLGTTSNLVRKIDVSLDDRKTGASRGRSGG